MKANIVLRFDKPAGEVFVEWATDQKLAFNDLWDDEAPFAQGTMFRVWLDDAAPFLETWWDYTISCGGWALRSGIASQYLDSFFFGSTFVIFGMSG